jgi:hypothetical protein
MRLVKPDPAPLVIDVTVLPATKISEALVVVIAPEELVVPVPLPPFATSKGLVVSIPLYSRIRISGYEVDPPKFTVTVFSPPAMFFA